MSKQSEINPRRIGDGTTVTGCCYGCSVAFECADKGVCLLEAGRKAVAEPAPPAKDSGYER